MPYYEIYDPVLMKLSSGTGSVLRSNGVYCLEDLLIEPEEIISLPGVGEKRFDEIMDLLYNLPFDFTQRPGPINPDKDPFLGVDENLVGYIHYISQYASEKVFSRGLKYFREKHVLKINRSDEPALVYEIFVKGSRQYRVVLPLADDPANQEQCNCPAFGNWMYGSIICKHIVAATFALAEHQRYQHFSGSGDGNLAYRQLQRSLQQVSGNGEKRQELEYLLERKNGQWDLYPKKIYPLINSLNTKSLYSYNYKNPWNTLTPENSRDQLIISCLNQVYNSERIYAGYYSDTVSEIELGEILELIKGRTLYLKHEKEPASVISYSDQTFDLFLAIGRNESEEAESPGLNIECKLHSNGRIYSGDEVEFVQTDPVWVLADGQIAKLNANERALNIFFSLSNSSIHVPSDELEPFLKDLYPMLLKADIPVQFSDELKEESEPVDPEPALYLRESGKMLQADLRIVYNGFEIDGNNEAEEILVPLSLTNHKTNGSALLLSVKRQPNKEQAFVNQVLESGLEQAGNSWQFSPCGDSLEWVIDQLPRLIKAGFSIYGQKNLVRYARPKKMTSSSFRVKTRENWFEVEGSFSFGEITLGMNDIQQVLVKDKTFIKLHDDSLGELPENWVKQLKSLMQLTGNSGENSKIPKIAAIVIEEIAKEADNSESDPDFEEYAGRLKSFETIEPISAPNGFYGELRQYQSAGLSWMNFLNTYGFGGILADDMGLGKTIQVLALLRKISERSARRINCLIIAPRSVIQNWVAEAGKFVPDFEVNVHHGTARASSTDELADCDLLITTYGTMRNDINLLKDKEFDYAILDESHSVRNPASKTFRSLKMIRAKNRICMTGTPVQNTTMDLWSQFEFLNPGFLGGQKSFRDRWVKPVERDGDQAAEELLHKMVAPFILRRTKQQVATDLPPLTSTRVDCPMDVTQHALYEKYRKVYYELVNKSIDSNGINKARFAVLEGLLRLRQISCSPKLIEGESGPSAKLSRFVELAEELISEGHRALVFSQFVGFLKLIEAEVKKQGWSYEYLDGQTNDRQERVDRFQGDESKKLFLISLKAGGEGLNLTGADYVFIMDPWWNPAAERQAMDRTHRIGQKEKVFVYRFVSPDTVEEKILRLQDRKRNLAEKLVVADSGIFKELNKKDLIALFE
ncbi:MAG: DEAD/DEAH box helicase [Balneolaceae bacterium]